MLVYSAIQIEQIHDAIRATVALNFDPWPSKCSSRMTADSLIGVHPFLIAVPCVIAFAIILLVFITWKLFDEFGWKIYKVIGASVQMRRRYLIYQIFISLLKFDFFFCILIISLPSDDSLGL